MDLCHGLVLTLLWAPIQEPLQQPPSESIPPLIESSPAPVEGAGELSRPKERPAGKPTPVTATFHDGTRIERVQLIGNVDLQTKYGKLSISPKDIRRIEVKHRVSAGTVVRMNQLIGKIGNQNHAIGQTAIKELLAMGSLAYPTLMGACNSKSPGIANQAAYVMSILDQRFGRVVVKPYDVIYVGEEGVLTGEITTKTLKVSTPYFGEMELKLKDLGLIETEAFRTLRSATCASQGGYSSIQREWVHPSAQPVQSAPPQSPSLGSTSGGGTPAMQSPTRGRANNEKLYQSYLGVAR